MYLHPSRLRSMIVKTMVLASLEARTITETTVFACLEKQQIKKKNNICVPRGSHHCEIKCICFLETHRLVKTLVFVLSMPCGSNHGTNDGVCVSRSSNHSRNNGTCVSRGSHHNKENGDCISRGSNHWKNKWYLRPSKFKSL